MNLLQLSDEDLAKRFHREHTEQFNILVRMHLSFVLDLNTEETDLLTDKSKLKKWGLGAFGKKIKTKCIAEGTPLTQEGICQVYQLIEFLKKEQNISVEGIFRRTGALTRQQELRNLLIQGATLNLEGGQFSVHDCASVLKGFLAELPEPLLTEAHYAAYCQIADLCNTDQRQSSSTELTSPCLHPPIIQSTLTKSSNFASAHSSRLLQSLQLLLLLLPTTNLHLLHDLLQLLHLTSLESRNKMSATSLATLFTPHLLCPRRLSPENLHGQYGSLSAILAFMIEVGPKEVFRVPEKLSVDIRAWYVERERRKREKMEAKDNKKDRDKEPRESNLSLVNESVGDVYAANTVYRFVDIERTTLENATNPTETALAQLYAHIQSLPESAKKRKLVKQFNRENGNGTPLQVIRSSCATAGGKKLNTGVGGIGDSIKRRIFSRGLGIRGVKLRTPGQGMRSNSEEILSSPISSTSSNNPSTPTSRPHRTNQLFCLKSLNTSDTIISDDILSPANTNANTSTSTSAYTQANKINKNMPPHCCVHMTPDDRLVTSDGDDGVLLVTGEDLKRSNSEPDLLGSIHDEQNDDDIGVIINEPRTVTVDNHNRTYITSTPAASRLTGFRPFPITADTECLDRKSMSPITRSTHAMCRAMQETMMTPRSRKPVLLISGTNINKLATSPDLTSTKPCMENVAEESAEHDLIDLKSPPAKLQKSSVDGCQQDVNVSLTSTFRDYLNSRSLLSTNDYSFSSRTDDYNSNDDINESKMTESLRLCLDGKDPDEEKDFYEGKQLVLKPKQFDENGKAIIFETSF